MHWRVQRWGRGTQGEGGCVVPYSHSGVHILEALLLCPDEFSECQQELCRWRIRKPEEWSVQALQTRCGRQWAPPSHPHSTVQNSLIWPHSDAELLITVISAWVSFLRQCCAPEGKQDVCRLLTSLPCFPVETRYHSQGLQVFEAIPDLSEASLSKETHMHTFSVAKGPTGKL